MVSPYAEAIDFDELERQGLKAIDRDARYWRENDAKFRAVEQKVASYEEFREIVRASHLNPLDKADKAALGPMTQTKSSCWNPTAAKAKGSGGAEEVVISGEQNVVPSSSVKALPTNLSEFSTQWRILISVESQYNYLSELSESLLLKIFETEIPTPILMDIVGTLKNMLLSVQNSAEVFETAILLLNVFSRSSRFSLMLLFLSETEKAAIIELLTVLENSLPSNESTDPSKFENLKKVYNHK